MDQQAAGQRPEGSLSDAEAGKPAGAYTIATSVLQNSNDLVAAVDSELRFVALNAPFRREFELIFGIPV